VIRRRSNRGPSRRRGVALAAVLLIGMGLMIIALGVIHLVRADVASLGAAEDLEQSRLLARSGIRAVAAELARSRPAMLRGETPELPARIELLELEAGDNARIGVAMLLPVGPGGARLVAEAGRIDLNEVDAEGIADTGLVSMLEARTIVAARDARPGGRFESVLDLLSLEGDVTFTPERMLGPLDEIRILSRVDAAESSTGERILERLDADLGGDVRGLADLFTVNAFEPDVRFDGTPRLDPDSTDPEAVADAGIEDPATVELLERFFGSAVDGGAEPAPDRRNRRKRENRRRKDDSNASDDVPAPGPESPASGGPMSRLRRVVRDDGADSGLALDAIARDPGAWRNGLLDINTASVAAMQSVDGIDPPLATAIAARRESLAVDRRFSRLWPVEEGLVEAAVWDEVADRITTRSTVWRFVIAVGVEREGPAEGLETPTAWEVVLDCGSMPPRVVELRDVTMLELAARMTGSEPGAINGRMADVDDEAATDRSSDDPFGDDPLFGGDPPLFDEGSMFDGAPSMFDDEDSLFEDEAPLFDDSESAFDGPDRFPDDLGSRTEATPSAGGDGDRGPGGRWRPATGGR
jgi:DNA uptake protein ComE-like DNA-binding protein